MIFWIFLFFKFIFKYFKNKIWCENIFYTWQVKKKAKSAPRKQICWVGWGKGVFWKKMFYKDANQTENFTGVENTINP